MTSREEKILSAVRKGAPVKKRVTFYISEATKSALTRWCEKEGVVESGVIEELIKDTVPEKFFKDEKSAKD